MKKKFFLFILSFVLTFSFAGCDLNTEETTDEIVGNIAYDVNPNGEYRVYLKEGTEYVPYLVLTNNYNEEGVCLLLREFLLEESKAYNHKTKDAEYYQNSDIDKFLSDEFYNSFSEKDRSLMINCNVVVTIPSQELKKTENNLIAPTETINLRRKVFLLSYTEMGGNPHHVIPVEGVPLGYFDSPKRKVAEGEGEGVSSWWLRTPNFVDKDYVSVVTSEGVLSSMCIYDKLSPHCEGVRPAVVVSPDTKIEKITINEKEVYILTK